MRALVIGASGTIGLPLTERLLRNGWTVAACYRSNRARLADLHEAFDHRLHTVAIDLLDIAGLERSIKDTGNGIGGFDAMVNVAGLAGKPDFLVRVNAQRIHELIAVNLTGIICATKFALPFLIKQGASAVLNVSSVSASAPTAGITAYAATKAGIEGFTLALGREYAQRGLSANCARLGPVRTAMLEALGPDRVAAMASALPRRQLPQPAQVAEILEQCIQQALHGTINGSILTIDNGYTMWRSA